MKLKKEDPFLYYSIPSVVRATKLRDTKNVLTSNQNSSTQTRTKSMSNASSTCPSRVTRKNRISLETYPDLLVEDFITRMEDLEADTYSYADNNKEVVDDLIFTTFLNCFDH